jgi:hypothetical protein
MVRPISVTTLPDWSAAAGCLQLQGSPRDPVTFARCEARRATSLGIDMSKPSLQLIHCSNGIRPGAKRAQNGRSFRPLVIDGGVKSAAGRHTWEIALELFDLGLHVCYGNYLALVEVSMIILNDPNGTERPGRPA